MFIYILGLRKYVNPQKKSVSPQKKRKRRDESDSESSFDDDYSGTTEPSTEIDFPDDDEVSDTQDDDLEFFDWDG